MSVIYAIIAYILMGGVCAWVFYQCWKDSKSDFRMIWRELRYIIKKKRADRSGRNANDRHRNIVYVDFTKNQ